VVTDDSAAGPLNSNISTVSGWRNPENAFGKAPPGRDHCNRVGHQCTNEVGEIVAEFCKL
jgi:hypothetical protein